MSELTLLSQHACFGGEQRFYQHDSKTIGLPMRFGIYLPPQAKQDKVAAVMYLAGLTCNEETFAFKAGAQRVASELGMALITPDTSPRGANVAGESDAWDFGLAASFYLDAKSLPWARHWRMETYLLLELLPLISLELPISADQMGITGHSMGGHGALTLALKHPGRFKSVSAFAPICAPTQCPWGVKAFSGYLGSTDTDKALWASHDATELMNRLSSVPYPQGILIDQGLSDKFLVDQLHPAAFEKACATIGQPLQLRQHAGYDHGYFFVSSFVADHLRFHHDQLVA
jgi:S-formylglutathione hydrolase